MSCNDYKIAIIGLGYVGLPLAIEFGKIYKTIGFDINNSRITDLINGVDNTLEVDSKTLKEKKFLTFTNEINRILDCNIYIVTVPTPIDDNNKPDLSALKNSTEMVGKLLNIGDIVIYESTVFPGATEEVCVPILEKNSKLIFNKDFFCGYSPERINPGDKQHDISSIKKVTSGSTIKTSEVVDLLYKKIIKAGTFKAKSIKVAEAAKVIENTQRDVNIALINEFAIIFSRLNINTEDILDAAATKWNFLSFKPGLVGGHCIGIDPYYLAHKSIEVGYVPKVILAGREVNDNMGFFVVDQVHDLMFKKNIDINNSKILIMGLTFKENCPDYRNTKVADLITGFAKFKCNVDILDPWVDCDSAEYLYDVNIFNDPEKIPTNFYDAVIIAVQHRQFKSFGANKIKSYGRKNHVLYDIKFVLNSAESDGRL